MAYSRSYELLMEERGTVNRLAVTVHLQARPATLDPPETSTGSSPSSPFLSTDLLVAGRVQQPPERRSRGQRCTGHHPGHPPPASS